MARLATALVLVASLLGLAGSSPTTAAAAPASAAVFFDHLDDWSRAPRHSAALTLDKADPARFGGDVSRATGPAGATVEWFGYGITSFHAVAFVPPTGAVTHPAFLTSADATTWRSVTPTITGGTGDWRRYEYRLAGLANVNHVRIVWPAGPLQLSTIDYTAAPVASYEDPLDSWARSNQHTGGLALLTNDPASFGGDASRIGRTTAASESVVWRAVGVYSFHATAWFPRSTPVSHLALETSADGVTWQAATPAIAPGAGTTNWARYDYYLLFLSGVNHVRVRWTGSTPQLGNVDYTTLPTGIVQRDGPTLVLDGNPYRFSGSNIFWLGVRGRRVDGQVVTARPTRFEVDDVLATAVEMGTTVVRSMSLATSVGCPVCLEPQRGVFDEEAFRHLDLVIARAAAAGIRLVLPLTDANDAYFGGNHIYERWRGAPDGAFYTDPTVIADFKVHVRRVLERVNTVTGVPYRDDPTILAWETGNEVIPPAAWTAEITQFIRSLDPKHLIVDGHPIVDVVTMGLPTIDVLSTHFYPMSASRLGDELYRAALAGKPLYVGEYGWSLGGGTDLPTFLSIMRANPGVVGDDFWSLFGHADKWGYLLHRDGYAVHYPGDDAPMRAAAQALRSHAFGMRSAPVPAHGVPGAPASPVVLGYVLGYVIFGWQGATLADRYLIQHAPSASGPWTNACSLTGGSPACPTDLQVPGSIGGIPLGPRWFRVQAVNVDGVAGPWAYPAANPVQVV